MDTYRGQKKTHHCRTTDDFLCSEFKMYKHFYPVCYLHKKHTLPSKNIVLSVIKLAYHAIKINVLIFICSKLI